MSHCFYSVLYMSNFEIIDKKVISLHIYVTGCYHPPVTIRIVYEHDERQII